jgi:acyl dehydratase
VPLYYEDIEVGTTRDCGSVDVDREEMVAFAERYDPQPIHVDEAAARGSVYGGLIASGWFTASLVARELVTGFMNDLASLGGRGMDDIRWHRPVRAGDELSVSIEVLEKEPSDRNPAIGDYRVEVVAENGDGETVLTMVGLGVVERREGSGGK